MKRTAWIDVSRGVAIIAVVLDHAWFLISPDTRGIVWKHTHLSIPWFIFLSGYVHGRVLDRTSWVWGSFHFYLRRAWFVLAYLFASLVVYIVFSPSYSFEAFFDGVWRFSHMPPYYYANLLLQLYLATPVLWFLLRWFDHVIVALVWFAVVGVAGQYLMTLPQPPLPFAPAGRLFGGVYLSVFFLGMIMSRYHLLSSRWVQVSFFVSGVCLEYMLLSYHDFIGIIPTYSYLMWAISLLVVGYAVCMLVTFPKIFPQVLSTIGKESLVIFLYHYPLLLFIQRWYYGRVEWVWGGVLIAVGIPALCGYGFRKYCRF